MKKTSQDLELDSSGGHPLTWLSFAALFIVLCGLLYPLVTTLLGQLIFPFQAKGSLLTRNGTVVGSSLVGQSFSGAGFFIGRPSSAGKGYDPTSASGSNYAASNPALIERATATAKEIAARDGVTVDAIPVDLIAASGSGLDPHISPAAAELQVARVARARGLTVDAVRALVQKHIAAPTFGILGQARVNVLELNLELQVGN
jgi:potassium-transporting ATPase KdpC subunit